MNSKRLDEPHVSFSQINTYIGCPLKYRFSYIDALQPEFIPAALPFGSGLHETLAEFYRNLKSTSKKLAYDDLIDIFQAIWNLRNECDPIKFEDGDNKDSILDQARSMLRTFVENVQPGEPLAIEQEFTLRKLDNNGGKLLPLPIVGSIDLIERDRHGKVVCVDHKSAAKKYPENKADDDIQLTIYCAALARSSLINGDKKYHCRLDVLTKTSKPAYVQYESTRNENDIRRVLKLVREVICGIEAGIFYPINSWMCGNCQFKTACKSW